MGNNNSKPWLHDIAVLSIFFARPDVFRQSFERIREVRPRRLLLWQDGPRKGHPTDMQNILKCREIAANIDWDCEVYQNFHSENMGCDPSTHYAHKWAFSIVDKCIILEDDIVPSVSFFPFCKELLDRYENDPRIDRICGMNLLGTYDCDGDYFFNRYGNSVGWATWKRVAEKWETDYSFLKDKYACEFLEYINKADGSKISIIERLNREKEQGIPYWEMVTGINSILNNGLVIYPSHNLICNVGLGENSTHAPKNIESVDVKFRDYFFSRTYEYSFPLKNPKYMFSDDRFQILCKEKFKISKFHRFWNKVKRGIKRL